MLRSIQILVVFILLTVLWSCSGDKAIKNDLPGDKQMAEAFQFPPDTLMRLTELEPCDILVKPNMNWFAGSAMVNGGKGFGHIVLVTEGAKDTNTIRLLEKVRIFESQARDVPESYALRSAPGFLEGDDFRFANITFGRQNTGYRYRLRYNLTPAQRDSIIQFVLAQNPDISSWRALKRLRTKLPGMNVESVEDKKIWYCSLLIWEAFYQVLGVDLDVNGGIMVFPNDIIASPYFDNDAKHPQKRVRF